MKLTPWLARIVLIGCLMPLLPLAAQGGGDNGDTWVFDNARGGFCIWYLIDPELVPKVLPKGSNPRSASSVSNLHAVLERIVRDEPRFATWIPSVLCLGRYATTQVEGRTMDREKDERPVIIAWQATAVQDAYGINGSDWLLTDLGGDSPRLQQHANRSSMGFSDRSMRHNRVKGDTVENDWEFRADGMKLFWTGRQIGDPRPGTTQAMTLGYAGARGTFWRVLLEQAPGHERNLIGSLRIEGKSDLAMALKASPARAVSPASLGGRTTMSFERARR